ncbi:hypothetical protein, partial [Microbacterium testaceum]
MALFSRRNKSDDRADTTIEPGEQPVDPAGPSDATDSADAGTDAAAPPTPSVTISTSSFRGV